MAISFMTQASLFSWSALRLQALLKPCQEPSCRQGCKQPSQQEACERSAGWRPLETGPSCTKLHCLKLPAISSMDFQAANAAQAFFKACLSARLHIHHSRNPAEGSLQAGRGCVQGGLDLWPDATCLEPPFHKGSTISQAASAAEAFLTKWLLARLEPATTKNL